MASLRALLIGALLAFVPAALTAAELPHIVHSAGKHELVVDGQPFLALGIQTNNSSNYPAVLPQVWPVVDAIHANLVETPVAWEQINDVWYDYVKGLNPYDFFGVYDVVRQDTVWLDKA